MFPNCLVPQQFHLLANLRTDRDPSRRQGNTSFGWSDLSIAEQHSDRKPSERVYPRTWSPLPVSKEINQKAIDLLRLFFMRKMPAFRNGVGNKIACHLRPHMRHIKHLAD
jgi:hypothetical protein